MENFLRLKHTKQFVKNKGRGGDYSLIENVFRLTKFAKCYQTLENTENVVHKMFYIETNRA